MSGKDNRRLTWLNGRPVVINRENEGSKGFFESLINIKDKYPNTWISIKVLSTLGGAIGLIVGFIELMGFI